MSDQLDPIRCKRMLGILLARSYKHWMIPRGFHFQGSVELDALLPDFIQSFYEIWATNSNWTVRNVLLRRNLFFFFKFWFSDCLAAINLSVNQFETVVIIFEGGLKIELTENIKWAVSFYPPTERTAPEKSKSFRFLYEFEFLTWFYYPTKSFVKTVV